MTIMWSWFFVPLGLPKLSIPIMFGVIYFWSLLSVKMTRDEFQFENLRDAVTQMLALCVLHPALILGFGYLVTLFM
jgi:hypothetical protein